MFLEEFVNHRSQLKNIKKANELVQQRFHFFFDDRMLLSGQEFNKYISISRQNRNTYINTLL